MLALDYAIGPYTIQHRVAPKSFLGNIRQRRYFTVNEKQREAMITLIMDLHRAKGYKTETMFLACSIADRFLARYMKKDFREPNLVHMATISLLLAAKLEQPMFPSFERMINLIPPHQRQGMNQRELVLLEEVILKELEFNMHFAGPIPFLERFLRLLEIDDEDVPGRQINAAARQFLT
jgi:hypothetical protein